MQRLFTLIIVIAILYIIIQTKLQEMPKDASPAINQTTQTPSGESAKTPVDNQPMTGNFLEKTLSSVLINILKTEDGKLFFENILQPMNKPIAGSNHSFKINNTDLVKSMFKIVSFGEGTIGPASCGHIVTVNYQILDMNNTVIEDKIKTFSLGSRPVIPGLDIIIVGMKIGETRQATILPKYAYQEEKYTRAELPADTHYKINVTLQEILPQNFIDSKEVRVFDDEVAYKMPFVCGDRVVFNAKITKLANGTVVYDTEELKSKIDMVIGDITYPLVLSYALHGKIPVGARTVIAKGRSFKALGAAGVNRMLPKTQLPQDEYFMLEVKDFE